MKEERVFCIPRLSLERAGLLTQGILPLADLGRLLHLEQRFVPRSMAESDPALKQVIPYQVFASGERYLVFQRGARVGEQRLAGRYSIGIGGHVNADDSCSGRMTPQSFFRAMLRERQEELALGTEIHTRFLGLINDETDEVGQVHLGAVFLCLPADPDAVRLRLFGEDLHHQGWWTPSRILGRASRFEQWSLFAMELCQADLSRR